MRWLVVVTSLAVAGFMAADSLRALTVGDYLTPRSGEHAGELGPWTAIVRSVGIDPRSATMKWTFVVYGLGWLAVIVLFALQQAWSWWVMVGLAVGSLWYLVPGTVLSLIVVLLLLPGVRSAYLG